MTLSVNLPSDHNDNEIWGVKLNTAIQSIVDAINAGGSGGGSGGGSSGGYAYGECTTALTLSGETTSTWRTGINSAGEQLNLTFTPPAGISVVYITLTGSLDATAASANGCLMTYDVIHVANSSLIVNQGTSVNLSTDASHGRTLACDPTKYHYGSVTRKCAIPVAGESYTVSVKEARGGAGAAATYVFPFKSVLVAW